MVRILAVRGNANAVKWEPTHTGGRRRQASLPGGPLPRLDAPINKHRPERGRSASKTAISHRIQQADGTGESNLMVPREQSLRPRQRGHLARLYVLTPALGVAGIGANVLAR